MAKSNGGIIGATLEPRADTLTTYESSGTWTSSAYSGTSNIDILIVAGGGGGGSRYGGGGGAGGLAHLESKQVNANTTYTVTVGAGGSGGAASGGGNSGGASQGDPGSNSSFSGTGTDTVILTGGGGGRAGDGGGWNYGHSKMGGSGGGASGRSSNVGGFGRTPHIIVQGTDTEAMGDVWHSTTQAKTGSSSLRFADSSTQDGWCWLEIETDQDRGMWDAIGTGDFTMETWFYSDEQDSMHIATHNEGGMGYDGCVAWWSNNNTEGRLTCYFDNQINNDAGSSAVHSPIDFTIPIETWHHLAMARDGTDFYMYVDGVMKGSRTLVNGQTLADAHGVKQKWGRGAHYTQTNGVFYLDEYRFSNTCRYPGGTTFTPQTTAFVADYQTICLLQSNTTNQSTTFTDTAWREGYDGGDSTGISPYYQGTGGGGAGGAAAAQSSANTAANGAGGVGYQWSVNNTTYAGGGGGGGYDGSTPQKAYAASGGTGGGGTGGLTSNPTAGTAYLGGGGGGGQYTGSNVAGANGGSGTVIISETGTTGSGVWNMDDVYAYSIDGKW